MSLGDWVRTNVVAVATWAGVALSLVVTGATHVALADDTQQDLVEMVDQHDEDITELRSDVRSIRENQERLVQIVERTEVVLKELDRATAELRALVRSHPP